LRNAAVDASRAGDEAAAQACRNLPGSVTMRAVLVICLLFGLSSAARAQLPGFLQPAKPSVPTVQRVEITEYGIYRTSTQSKLPSPGTAAGSLDQESSITLVQSTTTVPARLDVEFGFRYKIVGPVPGAVNLKNLTVIPQPGIRNPTTGNVTLTSIFNQDRNVGGEYYRLYHMTDPWEVVPGVWRLELWDGDRNLASQGFLLVKQK
jgi:hypothetical protein